MQCVSHRFADYGNWYSIVSRTVSFGQLDNVHNEEQPLYRIPIEGVLTQAREAVGQLDRRHRGAASEGTTTDDHEASGQLNERQLQVQSEGWRLVALGQT